MRSTPSASKRDRHANTLPRPTPTRSAMVLRAEFGDTETARSVLTRLVGLLDQLDADEEPEAEEPTKPTGRRSQKKTAE